MQAKFESIDKKEADNFSFINIVNPITDEKILEEGNNNLKKLDKYIFSI